MYISEYKYLSKCKYKKILPHPHSNHIIGLAP